MLRHYLKITARTLYKQRSFSAINIFGLSIGVACCLLIAVYVQDEWSYDRHQKNGDHVFRIADYFTVAGKDLKTAMTPAAWGPAMHLEFPEIREVTRIFNAGPGNLVRSGDNKFSESSLFYADSTVFQMFEYRLVSGDPKQALSAPYSVVLTQAMAKKYFAEATNVLGKAIRIGSDSNRYYVTGVMEDARHKSHFQPDFIASFSTFQNEPFYSSWTLHNSLYTYLLLDEQASPEAIADRIPAFLKNHLPADIANRYKPQLQKLSDIHLHSNLLAEIAPGGSAVYMYLFSIIALFILIIACINYVNLTTARALQRNKEVGVRKVLGADRGRLFGQFILESLVLSFAAVLLSIVVAELALPLLNQLAGKNLRFSIMSDYRLIEGLFLVWIVVGFISGTYPAIFLARLAPIQIMKGQSTATRMGLSMRRGLVVFQFAISVGLIIATLIISDQMRFMSAKKLGFDKEQVVTIPIQNNSLLDNFEQFKTELLRNPAIVSACASSNLPGQPFSQQMFQPEGFSEKERLLMPVLSVDRDFLSTLGIEIAEGRDFSRDFGSDGESFIINEAAARKLGWTHATGKQFEWWRPAGKSQYQLMKKGPVIGVVRDFHYAPLHQAIEPMVIHIQPESYSVFAIRIRPGDIPATLSYIENKWSAFDPENIFQYTFLDASIHDLYQSEQRMQTIFTYFGAMAAGIACLGLLGLVSLSVQQRTKEIGVRKVLGASLGSIIHLISKEYILLIVCANFLAAPVVYYFMTGWLDNFAYRDEIRITTFALAGGIALMMALVTVSYQAIKAATANPVDALKYE